MKNVFTVFCAVFLMPTFSAQAWIGGPFSNNTFFGEDGDDGVYEAVAIPQGTARNGIGLYRWGVTNNFKGLDPRYTTTFTFTSGTGAFDTFTIPSSGNVAFGGTSRFTHSWFIGGIYYRGFCEGTVNSGLSVISCIGAARSAAGLSGVLASISSGFQAQFEESGNGLPIRRFEGEGSASTDGGALLDFDFFVFGSKVSHAVQFFGLQ
ncbi:MAG: hypothetical protein KBF76_13780 [Verrucomicrobiales bacterium]|nr:hypothetical protein [Verrucomicrobiales bacterium]